ncbi:IS3 family transposase [Corynebacterium sanguinis]|uniref:IS3 family transposase n=1 Tax=Corynebacterium sanguinis TaxID=2594913 RepID=UPI001643F971|nr:IS3 family transposase [Corynebacterium sanguinis]MCT1414018.1 IS3 family transposase [Corynebacterium sanguinis]MCT1492110.1 IS3 family transposase [Corynebacterium sanguinis]MCT1598475.1 IS3 family transposase [Corynebacterium sanguinis]MCT2247288.1 IS3 family transposase [Corynebacterium sanguinis]
MPSKTYTEEFKRDAVALYQSSLGSSVQEIATDLGISRTTLKNWIAKYRTSTSTAPETAHALTEAERIRQLEREVRRLREERDILRKAAKYFAEGDELVIRFQFVDDAQNSHSVKRLCEVLRLNRSSYYKWKNTSATRNKRLLSDAILGARVKTVFTRERGCYGAKRITAELNDDSTTSPVNHKKVARIMRSLKLVGYAKKRKVTTTVSEGKKPVFPDLVGRRFTAPAPNQVYVGDITYLPIADGSNMYLATVIDCFSRRLAGFAIADHMRTSLVQDALVMAKGQRGSLQDAVFHSDHGSVYTSFAFQDTCTQLGVRQSMGAIGSSADNALAESFNAALKREVLQDARTFANQLQCRRDVFRWCTRYNTTRRHSWCKYLAPAVFEERHPVTLRSAS